MKSEQEIIDELRLRAPTPALLAPPVIAPTLTDEQSSIIPSEVSELGLLKLGGMLGLERPDDASATRLRFLYEQFAEISPDSSFDAVLGTVKDYLTRLGLLFREDRFMRLYLWVKLNQERQAIDTEIENALR